MNLSERSQMLVDQTARDILVTLVRAVSAKLGKDYQEIYDREFLDLIYGGLRSLEGRLRTLEWREEYLLTAIQQSCAGSPVSPEGGYLDSKFLKFLTLDGRIFAKGVRYRYDTNSLSFTDDKGQCIGWVHLSRAEKESLMNDLRHDLETEDEEG